MTGTYITQALGVLLTLLCVWFLARDKRVRGPRVAGTSAVVGGALVVLAVAVGVALDSSPLDVLLFRRFHVGSFALNAFGLALVAVAVIALVRKRSCP